MYVIKIKLTFCYNTTYSNLLVCENMEIGLNHAKYLQTTLKKIILSSGAVEISMSVSMLFAYSVNYKNMQTKCKEQGVF